MKRQHSNQQNLMIIVTQANIKSITIKSSIFIWPCFRNGLNAAASIPPTLIRPCLYGLFPLSLRARHAWSIPLLLRDTLISQDKFKMWHVSARSAHYWCAPAIFTRHLRPAFSREGCIWRVCVHGKYVIITLHLDHAFLLALVRLERHAASLSVFQMQQVTYA